MWVRMGATTEPSTAVGAKRTAGQSTFPGATWSDKGCAGVYVRGGTVVVCEEPLPNFRAKTGKNYFQCFKCLTRSSRWSDDSAPLAVTAAQARAVSWCVRACARSCAPISHRCTLPPAGRAAGARGCCGGSGGGRGECAAGCDSCAGTRGVAVCQGLCTQRCPHISTLHAAPGRSSRGSARMLRRERRRPRRERGWL